METLDDGIFPLYMMGFQRSMFRPFVAKGSMCSDAGCHMMSKMNTFRRTLVIELDRSFPGTLSSTSVKLSSVQWEPCTA
jgi:hypothetical protein